MATLNNGGWTGKTLRVNLTTRTAVAEPTKFDWMGGTGLGYWVLFKEVPPSTKWNEEGNKIIVGVGPLTGTGAPCGGRTCYTTIWPAAYPYDNLVATGHHGGNFGPELKFAGWDSIIIEGKASTPVWLRIEDARVRFEDATGFWTDGIYSATDRITRIMGKQCQVAAIGTAGANKVRQSVIMNGWSHSAGGVGAAFGVKNLKAIGVIGTGGLKIADPVSWKEEIEFTYAILGSNNQHVVPRNLQGWNEYAASSSRWTSRKELYWEAANPPVCTGDNKPEEVNRIGYRCYKGYQDLGDYSKHYAIRSSGCHACPIRCHGAVIVPSVAEKYGLPAQAANTCLGWSGGKAWGKSSAWAKVENPDDYKWPKNTDYPAGDPRLNPGSVKGALNSLEASIVGKHAIDDYGTWCNYGLLQRTFNWAVGSNPETGYLKQVLSDQEWATVGPILQMREAGDPRCLTEIVKLVANATGELGQWLGDGPAALAMALEEKGIDGAYDEYLHSHDLEQWKFGHPYHHGTESTYQMGALTCMMYNRDPQNHSHSNYGSAGLPLEVLQQVVEDQFGPGWGAAIEKRPWTEVNPFKVKFVIWSMERKELYDSLSLCSWMYPLIPSPLKARNYNGDIELESRLYAACTGNPTTADQLSAMGRRFFQLHRALTARQMVASGITTINGKPGTGEGIPLWDMRKRHDLMPEWIFSMDNDPAFTGQSRNMTPEDMETSIDLFYAELKWNKDSGLPTKAMYDEYPEMATIYDTMNAEGLIGA